MKKSTKKNSTSTTPEAAPVAQPTAPPPAVPPTPPAQPQPTEPKPEFKPDFYARLMKDRPAEAASILATICRRKDKALRVLVDTYKAGADTAACISAAMAVAFPKHKEAAP